MARAVWALFRPMQALVLASRMQALVVQVADLVDQFQQGKATLTLPVMNFLEDWLVKHIQGEDYKFALELRGKGVH